LEYTPQPETGWHGPVNIWQVCLCSDILVCKIFPRFLIIISWVTKIYIIIIQETHHCYTKNVIEQIMKNTHLLIKESICGIIFLRNIKKLDLFQYSNRQWKNIFFILIKIIIELSTQSKIKTKLLQYSLFYLIVSSFHIYITLLSLKTFELCILYY
jgi:hypothetical protein